MEERWFFYARRPLRSTKGLGRFCFVGGSIFSGAALLTLGHGAAPIAFGGVAVYLFAVAAYQLRMAAGMKTAAVSVTDDGLFVKSPGGEWFFSGEEICVDRIALVYSGAGGRKKHYPGLLVCRDAVIGSAARSAAAARQTIAADSRTMLLNEEDYSGLVDIIEKKGWLRPCIEQVKLKNPRHENPRWKRWAYAAGIVCCSAGWLIADRNRLRIAFLLAGLGLLGLLLNSFYPVPRSQDADTNTD